MKREAYEVNEDGDEEEIDDEEDDAEDEYKNVDDRGETWVAEVVKLENGRELRDVQCRYRTYGRLNKERANALVVCHALTGNAALDEWWGNMFGPGRLFDDERMFVICANVLGSCYGTTGPSSINPENGERYGPSFPDVTIRDSVGLHIRLLKEHLKVESVACVVGGSLGGMQTLEWAVMGGPSFVKAIVPMSCGAFHHPWQIAISEVQRQAIYSDPHWHGGYYHKNGVVPERGLVVARAMAMITYRSPAGYSRKFGRHEVTRHPAGHGQDRFFQVESYLRHQGRKFVERFDAMSYVKVTRMMDTHDLGRDRAGGLEGVLKSISQPCLIISVASDVLYPREEQEFLHEHIPNSELFTINSDHGHDGFLLCQKEIMPVALNFLHAHVYKQQKSNL